MSIISVVNRIAENLRRFGNRRTFPNPSHGETVNNSLALAILNNVPVPNGWQVLEPNTWYIFNRQFWPDCQLSPEGVTVAHCVNNSFHRVNEAVERADYGRTYNIDSPVQFVEINIAGQDYKVYRLLTSEITPLYGETCRSNNSSLMATIRDINNQTDVFFSGPPNSPTKYTLNMAGPFSMVRMVDYNIQALTGMSGTEFICPSGARGVLSTSNDLDMTFGTISY